MLEFGRDICGDLAQAEKREWLVTNGIGGFASGTMAGTLTRRYHGLLIAALQPPVGRTLLVSKLDEIAQYRDVAYPLYMNRWLGGVVEPNGYEYLERFQLEGTLPVWGFAFSDALLEKRIWMQKGANTTYVQYHLYRGSSPLSLRARALVNYRPYHGETQGEGWQMCIKPVDQGLKVIAYDGAIPFYVLSDRAEITLEHDWYRRFFLVREANRGLPAVDDHLYTGTFQVTLQPGESVTFVLSIDATPSLDGAAAHAERRHYEKRLLKQAGQDKEVDTPLSQLVLAADQFIVKRPLSKEPHGRSIIGGYHWFSDWGRDTMISLSGLTLVTGRTNVAAKILRTFAYYVDRGMLPNRFPDAGAEPEYNTVDATLWYFEAMRAYHAATGDDTFIRQLFHVLQDIIFRHRQGTRYNIRVDPEDGLLYAGAEGQQLTWMDAKVNDWVVTPRIGKPVEVNALWYNALRNMIAFARLAGEKTQIYAEMAAKAREGFGRFWNEARGYCYDVLDGPDGHDPSLRPNQILAVSLPHSPLDEARQKAVVDVCAQYLLTSHGLRSLAPFEPGYVGSYGGDRHQRDGAYHQGTVWGWLIGPFVKAHLRVYADPKQARSFLIPLLHQLSDHGIGTMSEIFDGDPPFLPRGCIAQAWTVAEFLRAWRATAAAETEN